MADSRFNSGSFDRGAAYTASVEAVLSRLRTVKASPTSVASEQPPPDPTELPA